MDFRLSVAALLALLSSACTTPRVVHLDTRPGSVLEYRPSSWNKSLDVNEDAFTRALTLLVLESPLTLHPAEQATWVHSSFWNASEPPPRWQALVSKSLGGLCKAGQPKDGCLSMLDDLMGLSELEKFGMALGLSFDPLRDSIAEAVQDTLAPQLFYSVIVTGLVTWAVLAANPEPVFTKAAAVVAAVMLIYLGVETFLEVTAACFELKRVTATATTFDELKQASQRFGRRVGPSVARVVILAVTTVMSQGAVGGAALLASRLPLLPSFSEAAALGASQVGIRLSEVGQVSAVAVVEGSLVITLAPTAVAMTAKGAEGAGASTEASFRSWGSYSGFRSAMGSAGPDKEWHHVVEQTPGNVERFGPHALHNTKNILPLNKELHQRLSAFYSSIRRDVTGSPWTVRQWLSTQSYEAQREFGLQAIQNISKRIW